MDTPPLEHCVSRFIASMATERGLAENSLKAYGTDLKQLTAINESMKESKDGPSSPAYCWYFLAMTHHKLGSSDEAQKWLAKAVEWTDNALQDEENTVTWNRRLTLELLRREAEALIADP